LLFLWAFQWIISWINASLFLILYPLQNNTSTSQKTHRTRLFTSQCEKPIERMKHSYGILGVRMLWKPKEARILKNLKKIYRSTSVIW